MSKGQDAIAALQALTGGQVVDPAQTLHALARKLQEQDLLLTVSKNLLCGEAFERGLIVGTLEGYGWRSSQLTPEQRQADVAELLQQVIPNAAEKVIQLQPQRRLVLG